MAGFILCRKSRDEDEEHESLHIQRDFLEKSYTDEIGMIYEDDYEEVSA